METKYWYDAQGRTYCLRHYDGSTIADGWYYTFDTTGRINQMISSANGDYWRYYYDGRSRLTQARRHEDGGTLKHRYNCTYDDGDNMLTKAIYDAGLDTTETTTFAYDVGNKLTSQSVGGVNTTFGYDAFGRMTSKAQGTYSAAYAYRCDHKLRSVTSNFPSEGNVTYDYGADGKRRSRVDTAGTTQYKWDAGWNVINEENSGGTLTRTYIGHTLAHVDGTDPSMGAYKYYYHDHLGSTRRLRAQDRSSAASYEYTPYGQEYEFTGTPTTTNRQYAMLEWDPAAQMNFALFRYYIPGVGRWSTRDPLGMAVGPNVYSYVRNSPGTRVDPLGDTPKECWQKYPHLNGNYKRGKERDDVCYYACMTVVKLSFVALWFEYGLGSTFGRMGCALLPREQGDVCKRLMDDGEDFMWDLGGDMEEGCEAFCTTDYDDIAFRYDMHYREREPEYIHSDHR